MCLSLNKRKAKASLSVGHNDLISAAVFFLIVQIYNVRVNCNMLAVLRYLSCAA